MRKFIVVAAFVLGGLAYAWFAKADVLSLWLKLACRSPAADSCSERARSMGHIYSLEGKYVRALGWYEWAAAGGDRVAMFHAGWAHQEIVLEDLRRRVQQAVNGSHSLWVPPTGAHEAAALQWYQKSAELGFAPAMNNLAEMYRAGLDGGNESNFGAMFRLHVKAANLGNPIAQLNLAADYQQGKGTHKNAMLADYFGTVPHLASDRADYLAPTFERTYLLVPRDIQAIEALKRLGELPKNWDYSNLLARVMEQRRIPPLP